MTLFEISILIILCITCGIIIWALMSRDGIKINYNKTITTVNKLDDVQLEIAKQNLEELKKYNENTAKQTTDTHQAIGVMTAAVQEFMGVNDETRN